MAGGPPVQLGPRGAQDWPSWSPDGAWVAYAQGGLGDWALSKMRLGASAPPEIVARDIMPFSPVQWSPSGEWIAYNSHGGLSLVSPDGKSTRVFRSNLAGVRLVADSQRLYGIRLSDDFQHLTFTSVDIGSGAERVLGADFMPLPVAAQPVRGFTRASPTTFVTSIAHVRSDVWLLEKFTPRRNSAGLA